jgi:hypothetical protein
MKSKQYSMFNLIEVVSLWNYPVYCSIPPIRNRAGEENMTPGQKIARSQVTVQGLNKNTNSYQSLHLHNSRIYTSLNKIRFKHIERHLVRICFKSMFVYVVFYAESYVLLIHRRPALTL